jgi:hypothetical protein
MARCSAAEGRVPLQRGLAFRPWRPLGGQGGTSAGGGWRLAWVWSVNWNSTRATRPLALHSASAGRQSATVPVAPDVDERGKANVLEARKPGVDAGHDHEPPSHLDVLVSAPPQERREVGCERRSRDFDQHRLDGQRVGHGSSVVPGSAPDNRRSAGPATLHRGGGQSACERGIRPRSRASLEASVRPFTSSLR